MFMPTFSWAGPGDRIDAGALPSSGPAMPSRRRRPWLAAPAVLVAAVLAPATGAQADGPCGSQGVYSTSGNIATCTYPTAGQDTFVVPEGVTSIDVTAAGAAGGAAGNLGGAGGAGASVEAPAVPVPPGEALIVQVGSPGGNGSFSQQPVAGGLPGGGDGGFSPGFITPGGGGGYSGLFTPTSVPLVIGAGGGGGALSRRFATGGTGDTGSGGATGGALSPGGGGGGGAVGSDGGTGGAGSFGGQNGADGTPLTGGAGGAGASPFGSGGGGGGGGYAGGGGGGGSGEFFGSIASGGGGGGGSSYGVTGLVNGTAATSASVTIRWTRTTSDATKPTVTITTPPDQATYLLGQDVAADYACADETGGSGLASCVGTVDAGAPIDTATVGAKTFTVTATDNDGNTDAVTHGYTVAWPFGGFVAPLDDDAVNVLKAGQAAPVKFSLGGDRGLGILAGPPTSQPVQCDTTLLAEPVEETTTAGASGLTYDPATDTYSYTWKTDKAWAGTCRQLTVTLVDGTSHTALFELTR